MQPQLCESSETSNLVLERQLFMTACVCVFVSCNKHLYVISRNNQNNLGLHLWVLFEEVILKAEDPIL
jgi:hypothetical protein